jgi:hypothetical protein
MGISEVRVAQRGFDAFVAHEHLHGSKWDTSHHQTIPDSRRKAYYFMAIQENLTRVPKQQLREIV